MEIKFAEVAVPLPLHKTFYYSVPESIENLEIGNLVLVPFANRKMTGYVLGFKEQVEVSKVKDISSVLYPTPMFWEETLSFYRLVADYYLSPIGEVIRMALPPGVGRRNKMCVRKGKNEEFKILSASELALIDFLDKTKFLDVKGVLKKFNLRIEDLKRLQRRGLIDFFSQASEGELKGKFEKYVELKRDKNLESFESRSKKEKEIIRLLSCEGGKIPIGDLKNRVRGCSEAVKRLVEKGYINVIEVESERVPYLDRSVPRDSEPELFEDQKKAVSAMEERIKDERHEIFLLHGITGSGKTEVYLRIISRVLDKGENALALVPEISLTPQFIQRFRARFGDMIAVLHSRMSQGERYDQWRKILRGDARIVIGARSAIFAPLKNIGIIVVDEEHDQSYKQEDRIMYNARDLAIARAKLSNAIVVLGSATPSLESYYKALNREYKLLNLTSRMSSFGLPDVEIVDLRKEKGKFGKKGFLSEKLLSEIRKNSASGGKTILFLNRRGFSSFVICWNCGVSVKCPNCSVSLKYHDKEDSLICHYCNYSTGMHGFCNTCCSKSLVKVGFGTEQLEREIRSHFPDLVVERMDRDTTQRKYSHEVIIKRLERGEIDVLIGTQMVSKGLDAKKVTLVGVVLADVSLNIPDFRSCERTFSLLTQVAGRSGRGEFKGKVIIQTYNPEHYCIDEARKQDYCSFFEKEIVFRRDFEYPPFVKLVILRFSSKDFNLLDSSVKRIKKMAEKQVASSDIFKDKIEILGPSPAPLEKLKGEFRWQILIKGKDEASLVNYVKNLSDELKEDFKKSKNFSYRIDIDPQNFM